MLSNLKGFIIDYDCFGLSVDFLYRIFQFMPNYNWIENNFMNNEKDNINMAIDFFEIVQTLKENNIFHSNISLNNLVVDTEFRYTLLDFRFAQFSE